MLQAALGTVGLVDSPRAKLLWIHNTLDVAEVECSEAYLAAAQARTDLEIVSDLRPLPWDSLGNLPSSMWRLDHGTTAKNNGKLGITD